MKRSNEQEDKSQTWFTLPENKRIDSGSRIKSKLNLYLWEKAIVILLSEVKLQSPSI